MSCENVMVLQIDLSRRKNELLKIFKLQIRYRESNLIGFDIDVDCKGENIYIKLAGVSVAYKPV